MTNQTEGQVRDAVQGNWVDTLAPEWTRPYFRLSRADRPIGTWLLYLPCVWAVLLAGLHTQSFGGWHIWLIVSSGAGAWLMRGAGCTWNDITDRDFDDKVARTRSRPIPSGQVTVRQAVVWMALQIPVAFLILLSYGMPAILVGAASLILVAIYPFAKRFTWWPQVFLGLAFNWGALLLWVAAGGGWHVAPFLLYASGIAWTLFYDTIYAYQDIEDDALIGVKSTARLFGDNTRQWLWIFTAFTVGLMGFSILSLDLAGWALWAALLGPLAMAVHMIRQLFTVNIADDLNLLHLFRSNRNTGLIVVLFFAFALFL